MKYTYSETPQIEDDLFFKSNFKEIKKDSHSWRFTKNDDDIFENFLIL
tara:strand:+ start:234 stop:377 length:144 start_codon:yes stop_codon:yes gene_type:complete